MKLKVVGIKESKPASSSGPLAPFMLILPQPVFGEVMASPLTGVMAAMLFNIKCSYS